MKSIGVLVAALALILEVAPRSACAQGYGDLATYERWSHRQWHQNYQATNGEMGPIRKTLHRVRNGFESFEHGVKQFMGDPDVGYYYRHDRRRIGMFGATNMDASMYRSYGAGAGYGQPTEESYRFMNNRAPTIRNARTGLFW